MNHSNDSSSGFAGKTALITGAASGMGRATAVLLAGRGASVCLLDRNPEPLDELCSELIESGTDVFSAVADLSDTAALKQAVDDAGAWNGKLDIVFANAGTIGLLAPIEHMPEEEWDRIMSINLKGAFLTLKYCIPFMKEDGGSVIVNSSIHGNRVFNNYGYSLYGISKAGLVAMVKMAALELAAYRIRVNAVCPGAVNTAVNESISVSPELAEVVAFPAEYPNGKYPYGKASPEQIAKLVAFLASDDADYISGSEVYIDGVRSLI